MFSEFRKNMTYLELHINASRNPLETDVKSRWMTTNDKLCFAHLCP